MNDSNVINFYSTIDAFGAFSNFASYPILMKNQQWPTTEHYFQAQKFDDRAYQEKIRATKSPMIAARLGRSRKQKLRRDWESVKIGIMREAVYAKFTQHPELTKLLLSTGDATLVEHTTNDSFWGDGGDGSGKNMLGKILMKVREQLKEESANAGKTAD
ncbi:MAG: NADAR family protein [Zavarzinella sp.]